MNSVKEVMINCTMRMSKDRQMLVACSAAVDVRVATVNAARSLNNKTELRYTTAAEHRQTYIQKHKDGTTKKKKVSK